MISYIMFYEMCYLKKKKKKDSKVRLIWETVG